MHEIEKNYEPRTWEPIERPLTEVRTPAYEFDYVACNSDSDKANRLMANGSVPFFVDYEILSAGEDPLCGSLLEKDPDTEKLILGVFVRIGPDPINVETHWYREV